MSVESGPTVRSTTSWKTRDGTTFNVGMYTVGDTRMVVLSHGEILPWHVPLVRLHSACLTSEALGSTRCDCKDQLEDAMKRVGLEGQGIVIYFPDHEGRGIGIEHKLSAYALQDQGMDTAEANRALGLPVDDRDFSGAIEVLREMGLQKVRLMTNNPEKVHALEEGGIAVEREPAWVDAPVEAAGYLRHKVSSMSHMR